MSSALQELFNRYRTGSKTEREKGTYFEELAKVFFENDPQYVQRFETIWTYADWAKENDKDGRDTGIDLVAKLRDEDGYCAIQCKFYKEGHRIQKSDIDSFFTASGKRPFTERLIIDTTNAEWSEHAEDALRNQSNETKRIGLSDIEESPIDWTSYIQEKKVVVADKKALRPHQKEALEAVQNGFAEADRGKMIMACGTGKTFTALKIAESYAGIGKAVLYLVPSLALMAQSVREWSIDTETPLRCFAVCSDVQVGKRRSNSDDLGDIEIHDLAYPATTDPKIIATKVSAHPDLRMTVIFSTYQSIQTISDAQKKYGLPEFDLIICDEAHRTTGAKFEGEEESNFIKVHNQDFIQGKKRLYMTATPRIYGNEVKKKADESSVELCSMDDEALYGQTLFQRGFSWAVQNGLLTDYKVIVLAVDEAIVSAGVQKRLADANNQLVLDDATKIIGCYKALTKVDLKQDVATDTQPMKRALAFCKDIKTSERITKEFAAVIEEYLDSGNIMDGDPAEKYGLHCELKHVDGTFNAKARNERLTWLKAEADENTCRILSNARCLSEGVDVPALDAIMFLHPRKSQIDVVQSVGRVMRRAEGKKMGYVILPIGIEAGVAPEDALNKNEQYKVVWQILNALRAHDDRLDATINKMELGADVSDHIEIIAVTNALPDRTKAEATGMGIGKGGNGEEQDRETGTSVSEPYQQAFVFDEITAAIKAKIVKKCGRRTYWEDWAGDIAKIARTHITRIKALVEFPDTTERKAFAEFLEELRDDLNDSITEDEAIEMLAQHLITRPVFDALFESHNFTKENPVSRAMQRVLDVLDEHNLEKESESLQKFYASVKMRASGIDNAEGKQKIIVELYDKFFKNAFPKLQEKLGIVYTPIEVVDFIIHSVNDLLQKEFGQTLGSRGVHILDPFTGTGTFITRLLQSGLIAPQELEHKYLYEIHANEIVLLAYYIAAINIEAVYHSLAGEKYRPFEGICLTDTFQLYEKNDLISNLMVDNSSRRQRQKNLDIKVIVGNPPYKGQQKDAGSGTANISYQTLDQRIRETYAAHTNATNKNSLYNSFVRAFRWASDRISENGIVAFVSSASFLDSTAATGIRKALSEEYSSIYLLNLRGDQRTKGEQSRKEGGKIFGSGSREPICITIAVKNSNNESHKANIYYSSVDDYISRETKLKKLTIMKSALDDENGPNFRSLVPDSNHDWVNGRDSEFKRYTALTPKNGDSISIFVGSSRGLETSRDVWCYNYSKSNLSSNISHTIEFFNSEILRLPQFLEKDFKVDSFINNDLTKISWTRALKRDLLKKKRKSFHGGAIIKSLYRPFSLTNAYRDKSFNEYVNAMAEYFPNAEDENRAIVITGIGAKGSFSSIMTKYTPDLNIMAAGAQCLPLFIGSDSSTPTRGLFEESQSKTEGISNESLDSAKIFYQNSIINRDDIFYYVYALFHHDEYLSRFASNLSKEMPRIPWVQSFEDFKALVASGKLLGEIHVNFESADLYPLTIKEGDLALATIHNPEEFFRVTAMKFAGKRPNIDKTTVVYNANITMTGIPLAAYDYVVNGKPALEWVMERQCVKTDKDSGIINDANCYAIETMGDPAYPLKLFQRVITVSLRTMEIVRSLPRLDI
ncbi:DNA damage-inducible protein [Agrobacterium vitis]|uniref:DEAD/DEAH box helicase n=1 Tax=Agrobacterium vitis TaxID=373 RepID=UPI0015DBAD4C|nr:type ISP restriction/modification enzyme [Agrobacterium vitis]BCH63691.1 DNA damage-inducible protein [Agrobacterium vitis]